MAGNTDQSSHWARTAGSPFHSDGVTRTYYISADRVIWDYAPRHRNEITGRPFDQVADTYVKSGPARIGSRYLKCLYRAYTNASFRHPKRRPGRRAVPRAAGPGHPGPGRRHDQGRLPQHLPICRERSSARGFLSVSKRRWPVALLCARRSPLLAADHNTCDDGRGRRHRRLCSAHVCRRYTAPPRCSCHMAERAPMPGGQLASPMDELQRCRGARGDRRICPIR